MAAIGRIGGWQWGDCLTMLPNGRLVSTDPSVAVWGLNPAIQINLGIVQKLQGQWFPGGRGEYTYPPFSCRQNLNPHWPHLPPLCLFICLVLWQASSSVPVNVKPSQGSVLAAAHPSFLNAGPFPANLLLIINSQLGRGLIAPTPE